MASYTIQDVEAAINWWINKSGIFDQVSLCREARKLAKPYAELIVSKAPTIDAVALSAECVELLEAAREAMGPARVVD